MDTLEIKKDAVVKAYREADDSQKKLLRNLFDRETFSDKIETFEEACIETGEDPDDEKFSEGTPDEIAYKKLKVIAIALNGDWNPDWDNSSEYKWRPWFYLNKPGFRFNVSCCDSTNTYASGGSRLCFKSEELSNYCAKQFAGLWEAMIVID